MPVDPNHPYADTPHKKTVQAAGYRYGCHGTQRGGQTRYTAHPWSANAGRRIVSDWLPIACGHDMRTTDPACEGCRNQPQPPA